MYSEKGKYNIGIGRRKTRRKVTRLVQEMIPVKKASNQFSQRYHLKKTGSETPYVTPITALLFPTTLLPPPGTPGFASQ
jgi:hypothetical protein